jgi:hypothetical protein
MTPAATALTRLPERRAITASRSADAASIRPMSSAVKAVRSAVISWFSGSQPGVTMRSTGTSGATSPSPSSAASAQTATTPPTAESHSMAPSPCSGPVKKPTVPIVEDSAALLTVVG